MTDSVSLAGVAVLCDNNRVPAKEVAGLYEHQIGFHYLPVAMLHDCVVREGRLCIGSCRFDVVVDLYGYQAQEAFAKCLAGVRVVKEAAALYPKIVCEMVSCKPDCEKTTEGAGNPDSEEMDYDCRTVITEGDCPSLRAVHMEKEEKSSPASAA